MYCFFHACNMALHEAATITSSPYLLNWELSGCVYSVQPSIKAPLWLRWKPLFDIELKNYKAFLDHRPLSRMMRERIIPTAYQTEVI